jgi:superfamily II DNA or RNA helicase
MNSQLNFRDIDKEIKSVYFNSEDDTISDFLVPLLKRSKTYKREAYSFSSAILCLINDALIEVIKNDCKIQYIIGMDINPNDWKAIATGLNTNLNAIEKEIKLDFGTVEELIRSISNRCSRDVYKHRLQVLRYLISKKILTIKIGFVSKNGRIKDPARYKFHPKVMIFTDSQKNTIVATGSTNESLGAHRFNEESFDVYKSWNRATIEHHAKHVQKFEEYWKNKCSNIKTINVNHVIESEILQDYKPSFKTRKEAIQIEEKLNKLYQESKKQEQLQDLEDEIKEHTRKNESSNNVSFLRPCQETVITNWVSRNYKGIFSLATGVGKTIAAIEAIKRLLAKHPRTIIVIVCPYRALCEQWFEEEMLKQFKPQLVYDSRNTWYSSLQHKLLSFKLKQLNRMVLITTNATFSGKPFQNILKRYWKDTGLVIDECHHIASTSYRELLNSAIPYRLGLSATPENEDNMEGNKLLYSFFKEITPNEFTLKAALDAKYLNEYNYQPILTELDTDEKDKFEELLERILKARKNQDSAKLIKLYAERDENIDNAKTKLPNLDKLLSSLDDISYTIIYCSGNKQLQKVAHILKDKGIKFGKITAKEDARTRKTVLNGFKKGYIKILLSIRVLDEGINIPAIKTAIILKSSARTRQSIQRRGRCLRLIYDKKGNVTKKNVTIYDFIVIPKYNFTNKSLLDINEKLINSEINRINEFVSLAKNHVEAKQIIRKRTNKLI